MQFTLLDRSHDRWNPLGLALSRRDSLLVNSRLGRIFPQVFEKLLVSMDLTLTLTLGLVTCEASQSHPYLKAVAFAQSHW